MVHIIVCLSIENITELVGSCSQLAINSNGIIEDILDNCTIMLGTRLHSFTVFLQVVHYKQVIDGLSILKRKIITELQ